MTGVLENPDWLAISRHILELGDQATIKNLATRMRIAESALKAKMWTTRKHYPWLFSTHKANPTGRGRPVGIYGVHWDGWINHLCRINDVSGLAEASKQVAAKIFERYFKAIPWQDVEQPTIAHILDSFQRLIAAYGPRIAYKGKHQFFVSGPIYELKLSKIEIVSWHEFVQAMRPKGLEEWSISAAHKSFV